MTEYFKTIQDGVSTVLGGMKLTWDHFLNATKRKGVAGIADENYFSQVDGLVTLQYPSETVPTPGFARYRLHNEADDCISCDQCARACPVNCIEIVSFKATPDDLEECGVTADGTKKKLWLPVFNIDMGKCMFCGLCTYPCPTECLTMTSVHDFSEFDRNNFIYHFGNMTPEKETEKRDKLAKYDAEKAAEKAKAAAAPKPAVAATAAGATAAPAAGAKLSPMMAAKLAAKKADGDAEAPKAEGNTASGEVKPAPKLSPMMAAKLAAKKAETEGTATAAPPESKAATTDAAVIEPAEAQAEGADVKPVQKLSPMMAAKLAQKAAAEAKPESQAASQAAVQPEPEAKADAPKTPPQAKAETPETPEKNDDEPPTAGASGITPAPEAETKPETKPEAGADLSKSIAVAPQAVAAPSAATKVVIKKIEKKEPSPILNAAETVLTKASQVRLPQVNLTSVATTVLNTTLDTAAKVITGGFFVAAGLAAAFTLGILNLASTAASGISSEPKSTK